MQNRTLFKIRYMLMALVTLLAVAAVACTGDAGPPGPAGPQGPAGPAGPAGATGQAGAGAAVAAATATPVPTAVPAQTEAPTGPAKVKRLLVAAAIEREGSDPTRITANFTFQNDSMYEGLAFLANSGFFEPRLASWEVSEDLSTWTWHLRDDVIWHRGFGDFTARDLLFSVDKRTEVESLSPYVDLYQSLIDEDGIEIVDDHTVVYTSAPRIDWWAVENDDLYHAILSRAHFDAEGQEGIENSPVGTGPYQFVERVLGSHILFERVPYKHWRVTPDFDELMILKVDEASTRLAMLLAGEAHIAQLPRDVERVALNAGMEIIEAAIPTVSVYTMFGGNFHPDGGIREGSVRKGEHPDLPYSDIYHPATEVPWVNKKVREALNRAVDRDTIQDTLFGGLGEQSGPAFFHPSLPGWNQAWKDNFERDYGYDPERAQQLLKEAEEEIGQPLDWSNSLLLLTPRPDLPELLDLGEAIHNYWRAIGVDLALVTSEMAEWTPHFMAGTMAGVAWTDATQRLLDPQMLEILYYSKNSICCHFVERDTLDVIFEQLKPETNSSIRDELLRDGGNFIYDDYSMMPLFWFSATFTVDPAVVADYAPSGQLPIRQLESVKAVK